MLFLEQLRHSARAHKSIVCMGADPVKEKIEKVVKGKGLEEKIVKFYSEIMRTAKTEIALPGAIKPNYAFFAQYGFEGLRALREVIQTAKKYHLPCILDAKRADIGNSSEAYAREAFDFWEADAVTVAPYMGSDSVQPFLKCCEEKGKGVYILNRTSNKGAADLQNLVLEKTKKPLYEHVSEKILEWNQNTCGNLGAVVGATSLEELKRIAFIFSNSRQPVPLLIPGVGAQGGSAGEVAGKLRECAYDLSIVRINSTREINYAFEKSMNADYAGAAVKEIQRLNKEIGFEEI